MISKSGIVGEELEKIVHDVNGDANVFFGSRFVRMMANPVFAANKEHYDWCDGGHSCSVMACAACDRAEATAAVALSTFARYCEGSISSRNWPLVTI